MPAEARITSIWSNQKLLIILLLIGMSGWFLSDGLFGYPRKNDRYHEWKSYVDSGREAEWPDYARQKGWNPQEWPDYVQEHHLKPLPNDTFGKDKTREQIILASLCGLIGALIFAYWSIQRKRVLRTDEEAVYAPGGKRVPFNAITGIGKKRWESKGIAKVRYELDGKKGEFTVDDYKFDTEPARQILKEIEEKLVSRDSAIPA